jgi:hypothetical protein
LVFNDGELPESERFDDGSNERRMSNRLVRLGGFGCREQDQVLPADQFRAAVGDETGNGPVVRNYFNFCHGSLHPFRASPPFHFGLNSEQPHS